MEAKKEKFVGLGVRLETRLLVGKLSDETGLPIYRLVDKIVKDAVVKFHQNGGSL